MNRTPDRTPTAWHIYLGHCYGATIVPELTGHLSGQEYPGERRLHVAGAAAIRRQRCITDVERQGLRARKRRGPARRQSASGCQAGGLVIS